MTIEELNAQLTEAYSEENLNKITLTLLNLYKEQQFSTLNQIAQLIADFIQIEIASDGKGFSKLMMLYHPDRGDFHRNSIAELTSNGEFDRLLEYSHIFKLMRIDEVAELIDSYVDIDYSPVYEWDWETKSESFNIVSDHEPSERRHEKHQKQKFYSFYDAFKIRIYGHTKKEIPYYYFEDLEEIELAESSVNSLDGIEFCKHAVVTDLSENQIIDISELWGLSELEELNLSGNQIEIIDALANLLKLRLLDISNNKITDLSSLFYLPKLESVNITGNPVPYNQIEELVNLNIDVIID